MRKIIFIYILLILILGGVILYRSGFFSNRTASSKNPEITIKNHTFTLLTARTQDEMIKGLSGRNSLDPDKGMLFIFPTKDYYPFWMNKMKFPLDIIYMNDTKIVDMFQNLKPAPAHEDLTKIKVYKPAEKANYVLEINGGTAQKDGIKIGETVVIKNINNASSGH